MPVCHTCDVTDVTAEMRRTSTGHVCKDKVSCQRRKNSLKIDEDTRLALDEFERSYALLYQSYTPKDVIGCLTAAKRHHAALVELITCTLQSAARTTTFTQKRLAEAVGVPASSLSGLKASSR